MKKSTLKDWEWVTLYNRETMSHRMLIGRSAMKSLVIDPSHAFMLGKPRKVALKKKTGRRK